MKSLLDRNTLLDVAARDADEALTAQTAIVVDEGSFIAILDQLNESTPPSDRLMKTLTETSLWESE